jgi:hypothetical protein
MSLNVQALLGAGSFAEAMDAEPVRANAVEVKWEAASIADLEATVSSPLISAQMNGWGFVETITSVNRGIITSFSATGFAIIEPWVEAVLLVAEGHAEARMRAAINIEESGFNIQRAALQIYNLWGIEINHPSSTDFARPRVIEIINGALQIIYSQAARLQYFNRRELTVTLPAGKNSVDLPNRLQQLLGPVRFATSGITLRAVTGQGELQQLQYLMPDVGEPRVFFLDRGATKGGDSAATVLRVGPTPQVDTNLEISYAEESPRFHEGDLLQGRRIDLPHRYAETIFLPVVKHLAASDRLFRKEEARAAIMADYQRASLMLGLVEPSTEADKDNKPKGGQLP